MSLKDLISQLREMQALRGSDTVHTDSLNAIKPKTVPDWPSDVDSAVRAKLADLGLGRPYLHQVDAVRRSIAGHNVVLESPTASGKTLAFAVPMLHAIRRDPDAHALLIYPMKAVAFDQRNQLAALGDSLGIKFSPYDGDTGKGVRKQLRDEPCHGLLTNPEYLNMSFLAHKKIWTDNGFLPNLRYVVIDEMHEYRGFFGTNAALLFRRLFALLARLDTHPTVFLSTATCANPEEHARNLTGLDVQLVSARNALRPERKFVFVKPAIPDFKYRDIFRWRIVRAALTFWKRQEQVLVFCPSKRFLEAALRQCMDELKEVEQDPEEAAAFHADIKGKAKRKIQQRIKDGHVRIVFTTSALELGVDIGGLDAIILAGFPSTVMSAWQQIGRAGRSWEKIAHVVVYAMNDPIDTFFVNNMQAFLNKPFDELVVDPNNRDVIDSHVPSLTKELDGEVRPSDKKRLGRTFYHVAMEADVARPRMFQPQRKLSLRGMYGSSFKLLHGEDELGDISELRRFREAYIGAIFPFMGREYVVKAHQAGEIVLEEAEPNRRTEPSFYRKIHSNDLFDGLRYGDTLEAYYGALDIAHQFTGYRLVDTQTSEVLHHDPTRSALYNNNIHAFWLEAGNTSGWSAAAGALEHLIRVGSLFILPIDRFDVSTYSAPREAYYYEGCNGGIGIAKKVFSVWATVLREGIKVAEGCPCKKGCPNCIQPAKSYDISQEIDKGAGIELAKLLLSRHDAGPTHKLVGGTQWRRM